MAEDNPMTRAEQLAKRAMDLAARAEELAHHAHETAGIDEQTARLEAELDALDAEEARLNSEFEAGPAGDGTDDRDAEEADAHSERDPGFGWAESFAERMESLGERLGEFIEGAVTVAVNRSRGAEETLELTHHVSGPIPVSVVNDGGGVDIGVGAADAVVVVARGREGSGPPLDELITIEEREGELLVECRQPRRRVVRHGIHLTIEVPRTSPVAVRTGGGGVKVTGTEGPVEVKSGGGGVDVTTAREKVTVRTGGGGVTLSDVDAAVNVLTGGGGIRVQGRVRGDSSLKTGGGSVVVTLDRDAQIHVDGRGTSATTDVPGLEARRTRLSGTIGTGADGELTITTGGGGIKVIRG